MAGRVSRRVVAAVTALGLAIGLGACAPQPERIDIGVDQVDGALPADLTEQMQSLTETAMTSIGASGAIVSVSVPWSGEWVAGLGTSGPGGPEVDPSMTFKSANVTRAMTCDLLYALVEKGTVGLDDTVGDWLDSYPGQAGITLGDLCDSTSGLAGYLGRVFPRVIAAPERVWNPRELVAYGIAQRATAAPGAEFRDSDTGYVLLGLVLERAGGESLSDLYNEYVFEPLGMSSSAYPTGAGGGDRLKGAYIANGKDRKPDCSAPIDVTEVTSSVGAASGGVVSTVGDLSTYVRALAVGARSYDADTRYADPRPANSEQPAWFTADGGTYQAGSLVGQFGSLPGYMVAAFADRTTGMSVVVVLNESRASSNAVRVLAWQLAALASKAPAADGRTAPEMGLPWTAESLAPELARYATCGG
ncbi:D-alanyl-D-alanine carboxypeptidase [Microbacterium sp. SORGH_AS 505]|uniref:serine hydrolase domain-containing protein n=1 Tax=Microbacterium sp. SORGH_AS_0505 TaxID=3041770 RepID=UPI00278B61CD|nr:serine hydrolase domain-containing protein [Microbacterium sp. SORGH_AS_0505]MDQ1125844.1 D-alanyl-D-alanine carboxypeptidase [Microbacterium sp. SORGH_AS_0505]